MFVEELIDEIVASKNVGNGKILMLVPHFIEQMTELDRVEVLEWYVKEGDIVQPDTPMLKADFLEDNWYLPVPPLAESLRVVKIEALVGSIVHLHDSLIVLAPV